MPRKRNPVPTYRLHAPSGQAVCDFYDPHTGKKRCVSLGRYDSDESRREHSRIVAEAAVGRVHPPDGVSVNELFLAFLRHADAYYRHPDGAHTSEYKNFRGVVAHARESHGHTPAAAFGPLALKAVRQRMIDRGWCRKRVNKEVVRLRHIFRWGAAEELIPPSVYEGLRAVGGLQAGRSAAAEREPVAPVHEPDYHRTLPHLSRVARAAVEFMRHTGCRPGEACRLTLGEVNRERDVWVWRPVRHKTRHRGKTRSIAIGPRAQQALLAFLAGRCPAPIVPFDPADPVSRLRAADDYERASRPIDAALLRDTKRPIGVSHGYVFDPTAPLFDPARDRVERYAEMRSKRKSKVTPSQVSRKRANPLRVPGGVLSPSALAYAVRRAAKAAGVSHWHPNQLRHLRATEVRERHGLEAAQVILGHSSADVTQVYAERDEGKAVEVAREIG